MNNRLLSDILNEPDAYLLIQEATAILNKERERRLKFYNDITEQEKAEFINGEIIVHSPVKKRHHQAHKIEEYWIIDPENQTLEQYHLKGNQQSKGFN